jgi:hypothetical protein
MPYEQDQINACFAAAGREKGAKKKKRESGCKKMVKSKHGHKESFEARLNTALFAETRPPGAERATARLKKQKKEKKEKEAQKPDRFESLDARMAAIAEEISIKTDEKAKAALQEKIKGLLKSGASLKVISHALKLQPKAVAQLAGAKSI